MQVTGEDGKQVGAAECMALLHEAGAEPQHCSEAWVANHYRWVVWKLASYERRCPNQLAGHMLTVPVILDQLKYRCFVCTSLTGVVTLRCQKGTEHLQAHTSRLRHFIMHV